MSSVKFTRDEAILALDVLYSVDGRKISADSEQMHDLSALLNRLPIHPIERKINNFRTCTGITKQLNSFWSCWNAGIRSTQVGTIFFDVAIEYEERYDELHEIAASIRKNESCFSGQFGSQQEDNGFPEGILLGHLHQVIELRDGRKALFADHCEICNLKPELCYQPCGQILQNHLLIAPTKMIGRKKYGADAFITVCPNCHEALHRFRPWITRENCEELLR